MDNHLKAELVAETADSLQAAYNRLFTPGTKLPENDTYSLAQPYLSRSVPSFASDSTSSTSPEKG